MVRCSFLLFPKQQCKTVVYIVALLFDILSNQELSKVLANIILFYLRDWSTCKFWYVRYSVTDPADPEVATIYFKQKYLLWVSHGCDDVTKIHVLLFLSVFFFAV